MIFSKNSLKQNIYLFIASSGWSKLIPKTAVNRLIAYKFNGKQIEIIFFTEVDLALNPNLKPL